MADVNVIYQVFANGKWLPNVTNLSDYAGIYGQPIQGVYANLSRGSIRYRTHSQGGSWLPWVTDRNDYAGIIGTNVDGLQMEVIGLYGYNVRYRVYVGGRWLPWVTGTSDYAGIYGQAISAIQVEIISTHTNAEILAHAGNNGLFSGMGITFPAFDVWTGIAILSSTPITTLQGRISLQSHVGGSIVDISFPDALATTIRSQLLNAGVSLNGNFSVGDLSATFNSVTATANLNSNAKVSTTVTPTSITIEMECSYSIWGITVYQSMKISMTNMRPYQYAMASVTVPVTNKYNAYILDRGHFLGTMVIAIGFALAAYVLVGYGGVVLTGTLLAR